MAIKKGFRFPVEFADVFPRGLVLLGDIGPDTKYNPDRNAQPEQKVDLDKEGAGTGLRQWKATVTDPDEDKAKRASFEVIFVASHQPVPAGPEIVANTGMRMVELEGLTAEPKVMGQGEFKYQGYTYRATGIKGDNNTPKSNGRSASDVKAGA
jgi:hypothetical protein